MLVTINVLRIKSVTQISEVLLPKDNTFIAQYDQVTTTFTNDPNFNYALVVENDVTATSTLQAMSAYDEK